MSIRDPEIRKVWQFVEDVRIEGGRGVASPTRVVAAAAVVTDIIAGEWHDDLQCLIDAYSQPLGELLSTLALEILAGPVEAFGKAAVVGIGCEIEHGSAIVHNLRFGDAVRGAAGNAKTLLPAVEKRGAAGTAFDIPLKHINDATIRSHHQSFEIRIPDAPSVDEIVVAIAMARSGRPHARLAPAKADRGVQA